MKPVLWDNASGSEFVMSNESSGEEVFVAHTKHLIERVLSSEGYKIAAMKARPEFLRAFEDSLLLARLPDDVAEVLINAEPARQDMPVMDEFHWRYFYAFDFESLFPECGVSLDLPDYKSFLRVVANSKPEWGLDLSASSESNFNIIDGWRDLLVGELQDNPRLFRVWAARRERSLGGSEED